MSISKKIFNKCKVIPFSKIIYETKNDGFFRFCGVRDKRIGNESIAYSIPNNKSPKHPNIKAFQREELDLLWSHLLAFREIKTSDVKRLCPELYKEGGCCFSAFYGLIDTIYPKIFIKQTGKIKFK